MSKLSEIKWMPYGKSVAWCNKCAEPFVPQHEMETFCSVECCDAFLAAAAKPADYSLEILQASIDRVAELRRKCLDNTVLYEFWCGIGNKLEQRYKAEFDILRGK